ncbi:MAG: DUF6089 family protein [Bacteroidales bacterium]|nr:DUF6089 family protein [Bacteroidales bacterium]
MKKRIFIALLVWLPFYGMAQYLEVGPLGGLTYYVGDLNPKLHFNMSKPAFGAVIRYTFDARFTARANIISGKIAGDDLKTQAVSHRNLNFSSNVTELSLQGELHFFKYKTGSKRHWFTPYLFGGVGIMLFNPQTIINGEKVNLQELGTEGQFSAVYPDRQPYNLTQVCVPFGFGVKFGFWKRLCLTIEWGMRKTFTDYLDDCSQTYYLNHEVTNYSNVAAEASDPTHNHHFDDKRGEAQFKDWYNFTGLTLTYKVNFKQVTTCIDFEQKKYYH